MCCELQTAIDAWRRDIAAALDRVERQLSVRFAVMLAIGLAIFGKFLS